MIDRNVFQATHWVAKNLKHIEFHKKKKRLEFYKLKKKLEFEQTSFKNLEILEYWLKLINEKSKIMLSQ